MTASNKMWINKAWLDRVGMEVPQTTEEFKEVLRAFKEQDANGNGDPNDEIPLSGSLKGWNTNPTNFFMNSFEYYDTVKKSMYVEDGKIVYSRIEDGFKEGLKYLNELYEEGLMDPLVYSQTVDQLKKTANIPGETTVGVCGGGSSSSFINIADSDKWREYVTMPPLEGPDGTRHAITAYDYGSPVLNITNACKNPEAVIRLFDLMFTDEGFMFNIAGVEDVDYRKAKEGEVNVVGEPAKYVRLTTAEQRGDRCWNQLGPWYRPDDYERWYSADPNGDLESLLYTETVANYSPYIVEPEVVVPPLAFEADDARAIIDIELPINTYCDQAIVDFIMGNVDIDEGWDAYIEQMKNLGVDQYIQLHQDAYDKKKGLN